MRKHSGLNGVITVAAGRYLDLRWQCVGVTRSVRPKLRIVLGRGARLHLAVRAVRSRDVSAEASVELRGTGAVAFVSAEFHGRGHDQHQFSVNIHHHAKRTKGDILVRGVYEGLSSGHFRGLLKIHPRAHEANSYFADNVLLFDRGRATSIPTLEILANDVRASHGSTTSRINPEQLFYLRSRGLSRPQAATNIISGFFHPVRTVRLADVPVTIHREL
ncbi:MAG: SufD family Fe-S cluster assembly protein [Patescibacteria group bacterium]